MTVYDPLTLYGTKPKKFLQEVASPVRVGTVVHVTGNVPSAANRFLINLLNDTLDEDEVHLHMSVRFPENEVMRCIRMMDAWWHEEKDGGMPFHREQQFTTSIYCLEENFCVYVNGRFFFTFTQRFDLKDITHISIFGDVDIIDVVFEDLPPTEKYYSMPGHVKPGVAIRLKGKLQEKCERFDVDLRLGTIEGGNIPFRISVRILQGILTCNYHRDDDLDEEYGWGDEKVEKIQLKNNDIDLIIQCRTDVYGVFLNNNEICTFEHILNMQDVSHIRVCGHIDVENIEFDGFKSVNKDIVTQNDTVSVDEEDFTLSIERIKCKSCTALREVLFLPCRHMLFCRLCTIQNNECPECGNRIDSFINVILT